MVSQMSDCFYETDTSCSSEAMRLQVVILVYGRDPIEHYPQIQKLRERDFFAQYPSMMCYLIVEECCKKPYSHL